MEGTLSQGFSREDHKIQAEKFREGLKQNLEKSDSKFGDVLKKYHESGSLKEFLPEISLLEKCEQGPPWHMEGNAFVHTCMVANGLPSKASFDLILAAFLHDIAKPQTRREVKEPNGNIKVTFYGHEAMGAKMAMPRLNELGLLEESKEKIFWLIENHLRILSFPEMKRSNALKFAKNSHFKDLLDLVFADLGASIAINEEFQKKNESILAIIKERYEKLMKEEEMFGEKIKQIKKEITDEKVREIYKSIHGSEPEERKIIKLRHNILEKITDGAIFEEEKALETMRGIIAHKP